MQIDGEPRDNAAEKTPCVLHEAEVKKRCDYRELVGNPVLQLVVAGFETGGRFNATIMYLLTAAAFQRAMSEPPHIRGPVRRAHPR